MKFKKFFPLILCLLFPLSSYAALTGEQQKILERANFTPYNLVYEDTNIKVVIFEDITVTFFGNSNYFTTGPVFTKDTQSNLVYNTLDRILIDKISPHKAQFINLTAKNEKIHAYVIFNINCRYCHNLIADARKFQEQGISLTFVPLINYNKPQEAEKINYILEQPAEKRFTYLAQPVAQIKTSNQRIAILDTTDKLFKDFKIDSYPVVFLSNGLRILHGYSDYNSAMQTFNYFINQQ
ncbi:hypothetical protein [Psittacicella gerlachiana]|uniref:Thiol:disulfide interchange protein n=1 Tax=Psittacicella gerlachiana TaxID=2028574 RepID=A0A3A1Y9Y0_9GAMM|nr:hypothetical protein [Psittacicella gerlachiana]RIY34020.1 hypothetical protein CKF59_05870 [Psittacicella gerlachiana]